MKLIHKSYKFRITPDKEQIELLSKHFGACRFVFNRYLNSRKETYLEEKGIKFNFKTSLIETIEIINKDGWVRGKMANLSFTAKVLDKKDKIYGIDGGRVIKLTIRDNYTNQDVVLYDRGFELKPRKEYQKSYKAILKKLNN